MSNKVALPLEVYKAFENLRFTWGKLVPEEEMNNILLNINSIGRVAGDTEVLKKFAQEQPTKYMKAIVNGYKVEDESELVLKVHDLLNKWLDTPYKGEKTKDSMQFAKDLTAYFKEHLAE